MKQTHVYEVRDTTDDEIYYPQGLFASLAEARAWLDATAADPECVVGDYSDDYEKIEIHERPLGPGDFNKVVFTLERVLYYDEEMDKYLWKVKS